MIITASQNVDDPEASVQEAAEAGAGAGPVFADGFPRQQQLPARGRGSQHPQCGDHGAHRRGEDHDHGEDALLLRIHEGVNVMAESRVTCRASECG